MLQGGKDMLDHTSTGALIASIRKVKIH